MKKKRTTIIAEAGVNHNGNIEIAKRLIDEAAEAGANIIKFQTFSADKITTRKTKKFNYQILNSDPQETQYDMLKRLELTQKMHQELIDYSLKRKIEFLSTGFDTDSINFLVEQGIKIIKIPSGEIDNLPFLRHIGKFGLPVILSTGMSYLDEIKNAITVLESVGTARKNITVLHCNTAYPTPMSDVNILAMTNIRKAFGVAVGYSDHTLGIEVPIAAVALGASIIEKHFTLDRKFSGPDHKTSLEPHELKLMVLGIRNVEQAMGDGIKRPSNSEKMNKVLARKSIVASKIIKIGDMFSEDNLTTKRPGNGISPMQWEELIGTIAKKNYQIDELITL